MAFSISRPIAAQIVVAVPGLERLIGGEGYENKAQGVL